MRSRIALALMLTFSWIGGLTEDARAGVTIDVVFNDQVAPSGITIEAGDTAAPGCTFTGYYKRVVSTGRCMDVVLYTSDPLVVASVSVGYDSDNGLAVASMNEWWGVGVSFDKVGNTLRSCVPAGGLVDNGGILQEFDCVVGEPNAPPSIPPGTYRIGTIVWDTSGTTEGSEAIGTLFPAVSAVINGNVVDVSASVVLSSHAFHIIPAVPPVCGDGEIEGTEECDDGGTAPGDGCGASCQVESGWTCDGEPSVCTECGDGAIEGIEECDDGGTTWGDGCGASCQVELGWTCEGEPSFCTRVPMYMPSMGTTGRAVLGAAVCGFGFVVLVIAARRRF